MSEEKIFEYVNVEKATIVYKKTEFEQILDLDNARGKIIDHVRDFKTLGFQATNLAKAYEIWTHAKNNNYKIVLGFTSNAISSGLRDLIALLCKNKLVDFIVTTGGAIEEDLLKTKIPFKIGKKIEDDRGLHAIGINRTENLYIPNDAYVLLEEKLNLLFKLRPQLKNTTVKQLILSLSDYFKCESSYLYWCGLNKISVIAGGLEDCAIGDYYGIHNYKVRNTPNLNKTENFWILNSGQSLTDYLEFLFQDEKKICVIVLGGGFPKHFVMNGCIAKGGAHSVIYMNNEPHYTGSNCGAPPEEAISWGKAALDCSYVKVHGDYVIPFAILCSQILKDI